MRSGGKRKHWIWYIFPQLAGLGRSGVAQYYGIQDLDEACEYLRDPVLRSRYTKRSLLLWPNNWKPAFPSSA